MIFKRHKLTTPEITVLGIIGALFIWISSLTLQPQQVHKYAQLKEAAIVCQQAYETIKEERNRREIPIDSVDHPALSGLIGVATSSTTTNDGDIEAKQTSINPNWSAVIMQYLEKAGVKKGENVVIGMTGSFPVLDCATLIAVQEFGANPIWIVSVGSSSYGANIPSFSWLDMEAVLYDKGLLTTKALGASVGGNNNIGGGLTSEGRDSLHDAIARNGYALIESTPLDRSIDEGMKLFDAACGAHKPSLYINIGGGLASLGTTETGTILDAGLNSSKKLIDLAEEPVEGYATRYLKRGIPVLNIIDITVLAHKNSLPVAPVVTPDPGVGELYISPHYSVVIVSLLLLVYSLLVGAFAYGLTDIIFRNPRKGEML